jgi:nicotinic acid mononucleotide adenylyltransferase
MEKIALYGGKFKPPHKGHLEVVEKILRDINPDELIIFISPKIHEGIDSNQSKKIWRLYLKDINKSDLKKIKIDIANISPITDTYNFVENNQDKECYVVYGKDDKDRYLRFSKYDYKNLKIFDAGSIESSDGIISSTELRKAIIDNNEKEIKKLVPLNVEISDFMNILNNNSISKIIQEKAILRTLIRKLILEGGNVFGTTDSSIEKDNIEPTLIKFLNQLSEVFPKKASTFTYDKIEKLGSAGKKEISGDIDLSYDIKNLFPEGKPDFIGWDLDENKYNELVAQFTKKAKTASPEKIQLRAMIVLIGEKINNALPDVEVDNKSSGSGSLFFSIPQYDKKGNKLEKSVQTDINIGNPEWLRFSYYSHSYEGNVKGLHRTQLMLSLFSNKGKSFGHSTGVIDKETGDKEASNPKEAIALLNKLYGFNITQDILDDYFKLEKYIKEQLSTEEYNSIIDRYLKILDSTRADIPDNLQQYWIDNQDRLGLKGKYLPTDPKSKLILYQKEKA